MTLAKCLEQALIVLSLTGYLALQACAPRDSEVLSTRARLLAGELVTTQGLGDLLPTCSGPVKQQLELTDELEFRELISRGRLQRVGLGVDNCFQHGDIIQVNLVDTQNNTLAAATARVEIVTLVHRSAVDAHQASLSLSAASMDQLSTSMPNRHEGTFHVTTLDYVEFLESTDSQEADWLESSESAESITDDAELAKTEPVSELAAPSAFQDSIDTHLPGPPQ